MLSPIDVWLTTPQRPEDEPPYKRVDLVALDHYISMAVDAKVKVEGALKARKLESSTSNVDASLMMAMVGKPEAAMLIGNAQSRKPTPGNSSENICSETQNRANWSNSSTNW